MKKETNFLQETLEFLLDNGKTTADVQWVGNWAFNTYGDWDDFVKLADFNYVKDLEIQLFLIVAGKDWWLERRDCGCSERWEFKSLPLKPANKGLTTKDVRYEG